MKNAIVYAVDEDRITNSYLNNSLSTLKDRIKTDIDIYILTLKSNNNYLVSQTLANRINVDEEFEKFIKNIPFKNKQNITRFTFIRLAIPLMDVLKQYDRILYLDTDTEIINDITDIFNIDICGYDIGAIEESSPEIHFQQLSEDVSKLDFKPSMIYLRKKQHFNAGVLLINMNELLKRGDYSTRFNELLKIHMKCNFKNHDQDIINIGFNIKSINKKYNVFPDETEQFNASIIHYICHYKHILNNKIFIK